MIINEPYNIEVGFITEYFSSALASDGKLGRGALRNEIYSLKIIVFQDIAISRRVLEPYDYSEMPL